MKENPFVSVVVPMYNDEKYIGECLDSLLWQKMKNFEVIIVDDCSTDNCVKIVKKYQRKFKDRLKIATLTKNGGAGVARNEGLEMSRGKYVFFMDSDDILISTALQEMYDIAEEFQADVVYCERYFMSEGIGEEFRKNIRIADSKIQSGEFVQKPAVVPESLQFRINEWLKRRFWMTPWLRLSSKDFLIKNNIKFQNLHHQNDNGWAFFELCLAKTFVRIPNLCYVRRMRQDSLSGAGKDIKQHLYYWMEKTVSGIKSLDDFMKKIDFFSQHPEYRYAVLKQGSLIDIKNFFNCYQNLPLHFIMELFENTFKNKLGEHDTLISVLFTNSLFLMENLITANKKIQELSTPPRFGLRIAEENYGNVA